MKLILPSRRGFTLVELLVVITIIGILMSLLIPAVSSARQTAQRMSCSNNMKNVALALHLHRTARTYYPHGTYNDIDNTGTTPPPYNGKYDRRCWFQDILGYIEQDPLSQRFMTYAETGATTLGFPDMQTVVPAMMCPSDPVGPKLHTFWGGAGTPDQGFSGNMVLCAGNGYFSTGGDYTTSRKCNGLFFAQSKIRPADIRDGASNTLMISELILSPDVLDHDIRGRYHNPAHGGVLFSTRVTPNTMVPDRLDWCSANPVKMAPCIWTNVDMFVSARSYHSGGVNQGMADGSVRFTANGIDSIVYLAVGSRAGGEAANTNW